MYDNLKMEDVKVLINKLMAFIVLEGKQFVDEQDKENYVKSYLSLFVQMINEPEGKENISKSIVLEHIFRDMTKYIK